MAAANDEPLIEVGPGPEEALEPHQLVVVIIRNSAQVHVLAGIVLSRANPCFICCGDSYNIIIFSAQTGRIKIVVLKVPEIAIRNINAVRI